MIHIILSVRDRAAELYGRPLFAPAVGQALRELGDLVNGGGDQVIAMHPGDFELIKLGTFDDRLGRFELLDAPELVASCLSLLRSPAGVSHVSE